MINTIVTLIVIYIFTVFSMSFFIFKLLKNEDRAVERERIANEKVKILQKEKDGLEKKIYSLDFTVDSLTKELDREKELSSMLDEMSDVRQKRIEELEEQLLKVGTEFTDYKKEVEKNESNHSDN